MDSKVTFPRTSGKIISDSFKPQIEAINTAFNKLAQILEDKELDKDQLEYVVERLKCMGIANSILDINNLVFEINNNEMDFESLQKDRRELKELLPLVLYMQVLYRCYNS